MPTFPVPKWDRGDYKTTMRSFGWRRPGGRKHAGVDLYAPAGTAVCAIADGVVIEDPRAREFYDGVYAIVIKHNNCVVRYGEVDKRIPAEIKIGASVKEGQVIGYIGKMNTIKSTMLHFEMYKGTESGPLTRRDLPPFQRRSDLIDPTSFVDKLVSGRMPTVPPTVAVPPAPPTPGELPVRVGGNQGISISGSVGRVARNKYADTKKVQWLLNVAKLRLAEVNRRVLNYAPLKEDGLCGPRTCAAIAECQRAFVGFKQPDKRVDPGGRTLRMLNALIKGAPTTATAHVARQRRSDEKVAAQSGSAYDGVLAWGAHPKVDAAFREKTVRICQELGIKNPSWLMSVMAFETGESFSPSVPNAAGSSGTGLIQFMKSTIDGRTDKQGRFHAGLGKKLGITHSQLKTMTAVRQLDVVKAYFQQFGSKPAQATSVSELYMLVLNPKYFGGGDDAAVFRSGTLDYKQNDGLDADKNGIINVGEISSKVRAKLDRGLSRYPHSM